MPALLALQTDCIDACGSEQTLMGLDATGGMFILVKWPTGDSLHVLVCELGDPVMLRLLASLARLRGIPTLHAPTLHLAVEKDFTRS